MTIHQTIQFITRKINKHFILVFLLLSNALFAQNYPVTCIPIVRPSYSLKWSEISTSSEMFKVHLLLKDLTKPSVDVYLKIRLSGVGVEIRTIDGFIPNQTIHLNPGSATLLSSADLTEYFNISNLVVDGIDISTLYAGGSLPEGLYTWTVEAYEIDRNRQVSNTGMALMNVFKNYPPIINIPQDGAILPVTSPQNILFSWTSRSTASLNAAQGKTYTLRIYELNDGDDPNVVAYSGITPFREIVSINPYFLYGAAEPILNKGKRYAVQVQEVDVNGLDEYENDGKSQVVNFSYGKPCVAPEGLVINPIGKGRVELTYQASPENEETYPITAWYKTTDASIWNSVSVNGNNAVISELRDKTEYEFKLSSACGDNTSTMSALRAGDILPSDDPSTDPETFTIDDSAFDEEIDELDPAILDPYTIGVELNADGMTRPVETLDSVFNKIIKPKCVTDADAYAECSPNHPDAPTIVGTIELDALAVGDVLGIYDYAVLVTAVGGGTDLSGKGLVKLPFLENAYMAVEFSGVGAFKGEDGTHGGCVHTVSDYFRTRPISQTELQNEQVRTIADIIKLTEPTVFHGDLEVAIQKYQEKGNEIASNGTATLQEKQDLLTYTKGVEVAVGTWKDKFSEVFGTGETDPKVAEILGDMTAILTQLNADKQTIESSSTYPIIPNLKEKIDAIIEKIKALQEENTPKPPIIRNLTAENITDHSANLKWIGDERFTKYIVTYQKIGEGEQIQIVNGTNFNLINLESNSQYQIKIEGYIGEQLAYTHPIQLLNTSTNTIPKPENLQYMVIDDKNVKLTWDKNKLHKGYKLIYKDKNGLEKFVPIGDESFVTLKDLDPTQLYDYSIVAYNGKTESESALGNFSSELLCDLKINSSSTRIIHGESVLIAAGCSGTITWSHGKAGILLTETPTQTTTYIAICEVVRGTEKKICTNSIEIVVSPIECTAFTINASKTSIDEGEPVTLTASGCDGELTWDNGFGTNASITIHPLTTNTYSAKCKNVTNNSCFANKRILLNCNIIFYGINQSVDLSTVFGILTGPHFPFAKVHRTLRAKMQCNNPVSLTYEGNAKLENSGKSYISLDDVKSDITLKGLCNSESGTCYKEFEVKVYDKTCDDRYAHFKDISYKGKNTVLSLYGCGNEVEWDNGMKGKEITILTPLKSTMIIADCGGCKEYFAIIPYEVLELNTYTVSNRYERAKIPYPPTVDLSMDGCLGKVSWFSEPYTKDISTAKTFPRRFYVESKSNFIDILSSYITVPTNPTVNTTYTARCTGENGTFIDKSFSLIASSNSCLRFKDNITAIAKGDKVNLEISGCAGTVTWKKGTDILGIGASITDVPLLETTYIASCDNPVCSESKKITVTPCNTTNFKADAAKKSVKIAEETKLTIIGCTGGEVLWKDENGEYVGIGRDIIVAPYKTTTYIATCDVSGCTSNVKIDVPVTLPPPILCEELLLSASKNPVPICEQVTMKATGCTNGKIEWHNGIETKTQEVGNLTGVNFAVTIPTTHFVATCKKIGLPSYSATIDVNAKLCFDALATPNKVSPNSNETVELSSSGCINSGTVSWKNVQTNQVEVFVNSSKVINAYTKYEVTCISTGFEPITKTVVIAIKTPTSPSSGGSFYDEGSTIACNSMGLYGLEGFKICDNNNCREGQQVFDITANAQEQERYSIKIQNAGCEGGQLWTWRDGDGTETTSTKPEFQFFPKKTGWLSLTCNSCTKNTTVWVTEPLDCNAYKDATNDKIGIKELPYAFGKSDYKLYNHNYCPASQGTIWTDKTDDGFGNYKVLATGEEFEVRQPISGPTSGGTSALQPAKYYAICKVGTSQCEQEFDNPLLIDNGLRVTTPLTTITTPTSIAQNSVSDASSTCATGATVPLEQAMTGYITNLICADINLLKDTDGKISAEKVTQFLPKLADALNAIGSYQLPSNTSAIVSAIVNGNAKDCDYGNAAELLASPFEGDILISDYNDKTKTLPEVNNKLLQDYLGKKYIIDLPDPDTKTTTKTYKIGNYLVSFYVDVVRTTAGNYIINGKEYKPLVYDGSNGFAGFYDISILPSINKDENGKYLTDDLNAKGGWLLPASQFYEFKLYQPFLENTLVALQSNFLDSFESYWNTLHKCTSTQLKAYENGIVPECFWNGVGNPNFAQLAGVIDETYRTGVSFGQFGKFVMPLSNIDDLLRDYLLGITCEDELWDNIKKINKLEDEIRKLNYDADIINFVVEQWKNEQIETLAEDIAACDEYVNFKQKLPQFADIVLNWDTWATTFENLPDNIDKYVETFTKDLDNIGTLNDLQNYALGKRLFEVGSIFVTAGGASPAEVGVNTLRNLPKLPKNIPLRIIEQTSTEIKVIAEGEATDLFIVNKEGVYTSERWFTGTGAITKVDEVTNVHFIDKGSSFKTGTIEFVEDANGDKWLKATTTASRYAKYPNIQKLATHVLDEVDNLVDDLLPTLEADLTGNTALKTAFEEDASLLEVWKNVKNGGSLVKDFLSKNILKTITKYDKKLGQTVNYPKYNNVALGKDAGGTLKQFGNDVGANVWTVETNNVFTSMYDLPDSWSFERSIASVFDETIGKNQGKILFDIKGVNIQRAIEGSVIYSPYNGLITEFELQLLLRNQNWYSNAIFHEGGRILTRTEIVTKKLKYLGK